MAEIRIPDISQFQGAVDWFTLQQHLKSTYGGAVAIIRLNYGNAAVDAFADPNIDTSRQVGFDALGWYTYLIAGQDPVQQADVLCRVLLAHGGLRRNEFIVCDDEESTGGDESPRVNAYLAEVDRILSVASPMGQDWWYSGLNFAVAHDLAAARGHRWIAAYGVPEPSFPHDLWQFTDAATIPGVSGGVDASIFHGSIQDFLALLTTVPANPPLEEDMTFLCKDSRGSTWWCAGPAGPKLAVNSSDELVAYQGALTVLGLPSTVHEDIPQFAIDAMLERDAVLHAVAAIPAPAVDVNALAAALAPHLPSATDPQVVATDVLAALKAQLDKP